MTRRSGSTMLVCAGLLCGSGVLGCRSDGGRGLFEPARTPRENMILAVSEEDPDRRREAVVLVAESDQADADWAIEGFRTIALLDSDPQARCAALRALGDGCDPRATQTCVQILTWRARPETEVRPPSAICRWDAADALLRQGQRECLADAERPAARDALLHALGNDVDRQVRISAARALAAFAELDVLRALIDGLEDPDFGVVYACEDALVALTGVTHECSPFAWRGWLEEHTHDAFANAGSVPESRRAPYDSDWERRWHNTRESFRWLMPRPVRGGERSR